MPTNPDTIAAITITDLPTERDQWHRANALVALCRNWQSENPEESEPDEEPTDLEVRVAAAVVGYLTADWMAISAGEFVTVLAGMMAEARAQAAKQATPSP